MNEREAQGRRGAAQKRRNDKRDKKWEGSRSTQAETKRNGGWEHKSAGQPMEKRSHKIKKH